MKKNTPLFILSIVIVSVISFVGCEETEDGSPAPVQYSTAIITHSGFDFSENGIDTITWQNNDGETISWQPGSGNNPKYPNNTIYLWWRNSHLDQVNFKNQTKDMGVVNLESITQIPAAWDTSPEILPLLAGHAIVAKCNDGYVKFKVISADTSMNWPAQVQYYFTTGNSFDR